MAHTSKGSGREGLPCTVMMSKEKCERWPRRLDPSSRCGIIAPNANVQSHHGRDSRCILFIHAARRDDTATCGPSCLESHMLATEISQRINGQCQLR